MTRRHGIITALSVLGAAAVVAAVVAIGHQSVAPKANTAVSPSVRDASTSPTPHTSVTSSPATRPLTVTSTRAAAAGGTDRRSGATSRTSRVDPANLPPINARPVGQQPGAPGWVPEPGSGPGPGGAPVNTNTTPLPNPSNTGVPYTPSTQPGS